MTDITNLIPSWKKIKYYSKYIIISIILVTVALGVGYITSHQYGYNLITIVSTVLVAEGVLLSVYEWYSDHHKFSKSDREVEYLSDSDSVFEDPSEIDFSDVIGSEDILSFLKASVVDVLNASKKYSDFNISPSNFIILSGPAGAGKNHIASALSGELDVPIARISIGDLVSDNQISSSKIADIFTLAEKKEPCIIFFDEFESIAHSRKSFPHTEKHEVVNELLHNINRISEHEIIFLAAVEDIEKIDSGFFRRAELIQIKKPGHKERKNILKYLIENRDFKTDNLDFDKLSTQAEGLTPGELRRVIDSAVYQKFQNQNVSIDTDSKEIQQEYLESNIREQKTY